MLAIKFNIFLLMDSIFCLFTLNHNDDVDVVWLSLSSRRDFMKLRNVPECFSAKGLGARGRPGQVSQYTSVYNPEGVTKKRTVLFIKLSFMSVRRNNNY